MALLWLWGLIIAWTIKVKSVVKDTSLQLSGFPYFISKTVGTSLSTFIVFTS